jgi:hypothetical protein
MDTRTRVLVLAALCLIGLPGAHATDSAIRSAQLFAHDGTWARVAPRSEDAERAEIQAHFAAVLGRLRHDTPYSVRIAAARFERSLGVTLSARRHAQLVDVLALRRKTQLERLADYAAAGRFPLNRHYAGEARPIFVDARGTHCAVGQLMAMDGREGDVMRIARAKPNVLVREVTGGPLVEWVLTSGLIQEEAALIQPGYFPPDPASATKLGDLVVPGGSLDLSGFRYENFAFSASSAGGAVTPVVSQFALVRGYVGPYLCPPICNVPSQDTIWFGVAGPSYWDYLHTAANQSITVDIDYDVVALLSDLAVGGAMTFESSLTGGFGQAGGPSYLGQASIESMVDGDASGLLSLLLTNEANLLYGFGSDSDSASFGTPATRVHVSHSIQLANGASFSSFDAVTLRAVPLTSMAPLLALAFAFAGRRFRRSG